LNSSNLLANFSTTSFVLFASLKTCSGVLFRNLIFQLLNSALLWLAVANSWATVSGVFPGNLLFQLAKLVLT